MQETIRLGSLQLECVSAPDESILDDFDIFSLNLRLFKETVSHTGNSYNNAVIDTVSQLDGKYGKQAWNIQDVEKCQTAK